MAKGFVLQAQIVFKPPKLQNIKNLVTAINAQMKRIDRKVEIKVEAPNLQKLKTAINDIGSAVRNVSTNIRGYSNNLTTSFSSTAKAASSANKQIASGYNRVRKSATESTDAIEKFGKQAAISARRYVAFAAVTGSFINLTNAIKANIKEAISFDREIIRLSQVTGKTVNGLKDVTSEINKLSVGFGVSSKEILTASVTLAQAGLSAQETKVALEALAKTSLSASFGDVTNTTEAAIAAMQQFGYQTKDLEGLLGSINKVSAAFAVEAEDITTAVRRSGAAFQAAGGTFNEFQAVLTAVRQTTRESAETISTGLRTIFARLQRVRTQKFFEDLGINLVEDGKFIGPIKAIEAISDVTSKLDKQSPVFASIVEEIGGFRQVSKVIPLLTKVDVIRKAINVGIRGEKSLTEDAIVAQQALAVQIEKVRQEFQALIRETVDSDSFRTLAKIFLNISSAAIKTASAIAKITPLIAVLAGIRGLPVISKFSKSFFGVRGFSGFASGGTVPGVGNSDTVPAMLTPGEFVINKRSAQRIGYNTLKNANKYNKGGIVGYADGGKVDPIDNNSRKIRSLSDPVLLKLLKEIEENTDPIRLRQLSKSETVSKYGSGRVVKGAIDPVSGLMGLNIGQATIGTAKHEAAHRADFKLGAGMGYASKNRGTLQALIAQIEAPEEMRIQKAKGAKKRDFDNPRSAAAYAMMPEELFAKFAAKLTTAQLKAVTSTQDIYKGIRGLKDAGFDVYDYFGKDFVLKNARPDYPASNKTISSGSQRFFDKFFGGTPIGLRNVASGGGQPPTGRRRGFFWGDEDPNGGNSRRNSSGNNAGFSLSGIANVAGKNPGAAGLIITAAVGALSAFSDQINNILPIVTSLVASFILFNSALKLATKETKSDVLAFKSRRDALSKNVDIARQNSAASKSVLPGLKEKSVNLEKSIQGFTLSGKPLSDNDRKKLAALRARKNANDDRIRAISEEATGFDIEVNEGLAARKRLSEERRNARNRRLRAIKIGAVGGAIANVAGTAISGVASSQALLGEERTFGLDTRAVAGAGGALSGAASGAGYGAGLGGVIAGPAGALIGAAAGAVAGGLYGLVSSVNEASKQIKEAKFGKAVSELGARLRLVSEGKLSRDAVSSSILNNIKEASSLSATSDPELRQNILAGFNNNQSSIEDFFYQIARESSTMEEFNKRTNNLLGTFATLSGVPFDDFSKSIEKEVKNKGELNKRAAEQIALQAELVQNISVLNTTIAAFNSAGIAIEGTNRRLEMFSSAIDGTINTLDSRDFSSVLKSAGQGDVLNINQIKDAVSAVGNVIPGGGQRSLLDAASLQQVLPVVLKKVANVSSIEGEGDFEQRLNDELDALTGNKGLKSSILTGVGKILGDAAKDSNIISRINEDVFGVSKELLSAQQPLFDVYSEVASKLQDRVNSTASALDNLAKIADNVVGLELQRVDIEERLTQTINSRLDRENKGAAGFDRARLQTITGNANATPQSLLKQFFSAQAGISGLEGQRGNLDVAEQQRVLTAQKGLAYSADQARKGLEFLARESSNLSYIQEKLAKDAEKGKLLQADLFTRILGTVEEKTDLRKQIQDVSTVRASGTFESIPASRRRAAGERLQTLDQDLFKRIITSDAVKAGLSPEEAKKLAEGQTPETQKLFEELRVEAAKQAEALNGLKDIQSNLAANIQAGITAANTQFVDEVKKLSTSIETLSNSILNKDKDKQQRVENAVAIGKEIKTSLGVTDVKSNFASLSGLAPLLEERKILTNKRKAVSEESFNADVTKALSETGATKDRTSVLRTLSNIEARSGISLSDLKADISENTIRYTGKNGFSPELIGKEVVARSRSRLSSIDKDLTDKLGENSRSISATGVSIPSTENLEKSFILINRFLDAVNKAGGIDNIPKFASGGIVPGSGNKDNVLAFLTPGERVVPKGNPGNGGQILINATAFNSAVVKFSTVSDKLATSLDRFPREITLSANHKVEIIFNGAEIMTKLMPEIQKIAIEQSKVAINKLIDDKFPDVGRVR